MEIKNLGGKIKKSDFSTDSLTEMLPFHKLKCGFEKSSQTKYKQFVFLHSAFEGHLRGSVISNFHDVAGFYMLVGGFSEGIGPQLP